MLMISIWKVPGSSLARDIAILAELIARIAQSVKCMNMRFDSVQEQDFSLLRKVPTDLGAHPTFFFPGA
jgi:hypothetical protein